MDPNTPIDEDAAMQAGFDSTEDGQSETTGSLSTATTTATPPAGQQVADPQAVTASSPSDQPVVDPFAGLPEAARKLLAEVPTIQAQLAAAEDRARRAEGQVRSLQGRFDSLAVAPAPTPAPKLEKLQHAKDTLGADMPEVVDALEELAALLPPTQSAPPVATAPAAPAAPAQATASVPAQHTSDVSPHMEALDQVRPDWFETMESADLKLWLTTQSQDLQAAYRRAGTAGDVLKVLGKFDEYRQGLQTANSEAAAQAAARNSRVAAAVVPTGHARAPTGGKRVMSEEEAMNLGFNS